VLDEGASNCLLHEGMHSLGFNGHPHRLDSLLSYTRDQNALTEIDRRLIDMLYHPQLADAIPLGEALTFAYIEFSGFREQRSRRYTPLDISLEVTEEESPLVLKPPFMANTSHQFYYKTSKIGNQSTKASYGLRGAGQKFAEMTHATLASGYVFTAQPEVSEFARAHESYLGPVTERSLGQVEHDLGHFNYAIVDSPSHSCVFTIKHISTGRDSRFHGGYCRDVERPMLRDDAIAFILAIEIRDRDPVRLREERMSSRQAARNDFVAISLIGKWPLTDSYISGLKLIARGMTSGKMLVEIDGETCQGLLTDIDTSGLGKWSVECRDTEDASGRFSWERDGTLSFRGETTQSAQEIHWTAYPVF
jgi:hypothetical protein